MHLRELCQIHSGHTARGKLEPVTAGGLPAIQLRDLGREGGILEDPMPRYALCDLATRYLVSGGEVIFRSRGEPNTATVVSEALAEPTAVIVPLIIMRPDRTRVLPEYLAWAINQPDAQRRLGAEAQGTSLRMIPMSVLQDLNIPLPDLATQRRIVDLHALAARETSLLHDLAARRGQLLTHTLGEAARLADQHKSKP